MTAATISDYDLVGRRGTGSFLQRQFSVWVESVQEMLIVVRVKFMANRYNRR